MGNKPDRITVRVWDDLEWMNNLDASGSEIIRQALREYRERLKLAEEWKVLIVRDVVWWSVDVVFNKK